MTCATPRGGVREGGGGGVPGHAHGGVRDFSGVCDHARARNRV
eukprot:CAMPEP_0180246150 /NCGR_PEP_ID=MMETSP0987-20121128/35395_1 /TAXON_ID=697907 /ORGANISM="non described non described, Strain CCMP2293" /LENGTH=42 /DNA_ID= /DNA_START= /DNA_END= /DNA_ORIENTATION=